jgi:hypothetical protein
MDTLGRWGMDKLTGSDAPARSSGGGSAAPVPQGKVEND